MPYMCYNKTILCNVCAKEEPMSFHEEIKKIRQKSFLSQDKFAKELGVYTSTVSRWENGKTIPNLSTLKDIKDFCDKYNLDYSMLENEWFEVSMEEHK